MACSRRCLRFRMPRSSRSARISAPAFTWKVASTVQGLIHRTRHTPGACELVVTLCDGTRLVEDLAPASNLLTPDEINKKFHQCTDDILSPVSPDAVIGMVERLDTLALVRELTQALRTDIR